MKILGIPSYQPGTKEATGLIVASKTKTLLEEWKCRDSVVAMPFDTTSSNTGHVSAAYISIQKATNKALLWTACRHHVGEIILCV